MKTRCIALVVIVVLILLFANLSTIYAHCVGHVKLGNCLEDRGCGCDPMVGACSDKKQLQHKNPAWICIPGGSKICIDLDKVFCLEWRDCTDAGWSYAEICNVLDPLFPEGYCIMWPWIYCQDCLGTGIWHPVYVTDQICL